jgi:hypothetical protein
VSRLLHGRGGRHHSHHRAAIDEAGSRLPGSGGAGEDRKGLSAGLLNTAIQLGNAWSLGIVATVVAAATVGGQAAGPEALVEGLRWGLLACVGFAVLAVPVVLFGLRGEEALSKSAL